MTQRLAIALMIALAATSAHAQSASDRVVSGKAATSQSDVFTGPNTEVLPVWNNHSGKVEAVLLLRPAQQANGSMLFGTGASFKTGHGLFQANVTADSGNGLALLCNSNTGLATLGSLAGRCLVTSLDAPDAFGHSVGRPQSQSIRAEARFDRPESLFSLSVGQANLNLAGSDWLSPTSGLMPGMTILGGRLSQQDITAAGKVNLGDSGWVSIGGTLARAQLIPADGDNGEAKRWNSKSVGVAVGRNRISGELIGTVNSVPGQANPQTSIGVGLSWRTTQHGKLSFFAEKATGTSPLAPAAKTSSSDEGTVPYVQYHQDL